MVEKENIFEEEGHWKVNAFLETGREAWYTYAEAYYHAGHTLWEATCELKVPIDTMVYPMLFCYRHFLELELKAILIGLKDIGEDTLRIKGVVKHGLSELWAQIHKQILEIEKAGEDLDLVGKIIAEFEKMDPISFVFRYPVDKKHQPNLPDKERMNIENIGVHMAEVHQILNGIGDVLWEYKRERWS